MAAGLGSGNRGAGDRGDPSLAQVANDPGVHAIVRWARTREARLDASGSGEGPLTTAERDDLLGEECIHTRTRHGKRARRGNTLKERLAASEILGDCV